MILFFNVYVTDKQNTRYNRPNLENISRFDIARYCFASYKPLVPVLDKVYFHIELADSFATEEHKQAMTSWLQGIFPDNILELKFHRVLGIEQWRKFRDDIADIDYRSIYCQGNDDHVFLGSNIDVFKQGLDLIEQDAEKNSIFMTSHWPEYFYNSYATGGKLMDDKKFTFHEANNVDSIVVLKRSWFEWYCSQDVNPNLRNYQGGLLNRIEDWHPVNGGPVFPATRIYTPVTEQFRHYDGYSHVNMAPHPIAPLEVPTGFFEKNIRIRYGYPDRLAGWVNVNPSISNLKTIDANHGTDYHWCLADIPAFWKEYIAEIDVNPQINLQDLVEARNQRYIDRISINAHWVTPNTWVNSALLPNTIDNQS